MTKPQRQAIHGRRIVHYRSFLSDLRILDSRLVRALNI